MIDRGPCDSRPEPLSSCLAGRFTWGKQVNALIDRGSGWLVGKPEVTRRALFGGALFCLWVSQAVSHQITNICSHFVVTKTLEPACLLEICENLVVADKPEVT
jgi:hypothetical protein